VLAHNGHRYNRLDAAYLVSTQCNERVGFDGDARRRRVSTGHRSARALSGRSRRL